MLRLFFSGPFQCSSSLPPSFSPSLLFLPSPKKPRDLRCWVLEMRANHALTSVNAATSLGFGRGQCTHFTFVFQKSVQSKRRSCLHSWSSLTIFSTAMQRQSNWCSAVEKCTGSWEPPSALWDASHTKPQWRTTNISLIIVVVVVQFLGDLFGDLDLFFLLFFLVLPAMFLLRSSTKSSFSSSVTLVAPSTLPKAVTQYFVQPKHWKEKNEEAKQRVRSLFTSTVVKKPLNWFFARLFL